MLKSLIIIFVAEFLLYNLRMDTFIKIAHRGASGHEPENTLRAFEKAIELGADMIEFDVHVCKSGEAVVMHDATVDRTTNGKGEIVGKALKELKSLDAGKGEKIPTLEEVLNLIDRKTKVNIELKRSETAEPVTKIIHNYVLNKDWSYDDFLVSSSDFAELKSFFDKKIPVKLGVIIRKGNSGLKNIIFRKYSYLDFAKSINAFSIHFSKFLASSKRIKEARRQGFSVFVWTVNSESEIKKFKARKTDGIFSDFPDRL